MTAAAPAESRSGIALGAIAAITLVYIASLAAGLPQKWTAAAAGGHAEEVAEEATDAADGEAAGTEAAAHEAGAPPPIWTVLPFCLLLGAIAAFPLIPAMAHWWESNLHRFYVAAGLGLVTLAYYTFMHREAIDLHWPAHSVIQPQSGVQAAFFGTVLANAILSEFIPFIVLLFSLYTIAGGIRITGDLRADPLTNAAFMAVGGLLASFVGTTGAAMLLIRPLLETANASTSPTPSSSSSSSSAIAAAVCCRSATRRCSWATCRASAFCGRSRYGRNGRSSAGCFC
jgi:hypothetical protein